MDLISTPKERLDYLIDLAWKILFNRISSQRIQINKESSLQLHLSSIIMELGHLMCLTPNDSFSIELEKHIEGKNIDIICSLANCGAAIELKCFRKKSNRATDTDMYDAFKDINRLESLDKCDFQIRRFVCLTDNDFYLKTHKGIHADSVSIHDNKILESGTEIIPSWIGTWKDKSRDKAIIIKNKIVLNWVSIGTWHYLLVKI
jgi:hypothetical protein